MSTILAFHILLFVNIANSWLPAKITKESNLIHHISFIPTIQTTSQGQLLKLFLIKPDTTI